MRNCRETDKVGNLVIDEGYCSLFLNTIYTVGIHF